jgi:hypothetical protein
MLELAREHDAEQTLLERDAEERRRRGVTFRELTAEYLHWLEEVKGGKPSTLRDQFSPCGTWSDLPPRIWHIPWPHHGCAR